MPDNFTLGKNGELVPEGTVEVPTVPTSPATPSVSEGVPQWMQSFIERQKQMENLVQNLQKENLMFRDMIGKNAAQSWTEKQKDASIKRIHVKKYKNKMIFGWENLDYSQYNDAARKARDEKVYTTLIMEDGAKEVINFADWNRIKELVYGEVVSGEVGVDKFLHVRFPDKEEPVVLDARFVNP